MKRLGWLLGFVLLLGLGGMTSAKAAEDYELQQGWNLRMGFFVPEKESARQKGGDIWFSFGTEKAFYEADRNKGTISIDYYGGGSIYNVPILLNARGRTNHLSYGIGAGVSVGHDVERGQSAFAYQLSVGYALTQSENPPTFDITYRGTGQSSGQLNGWTFTFGYQF